MVSRRKTSKAEPDRLSPEDRGEAAPVDHPRLASENPDPITGAPGAHPVGSGLGATAGGVAGGVAGMFAGPLGAAAGVVIGGLVGGLAGKGIAEGINPTEEHEYWRDEFRDRPYVDEELGYEVYGPAYQYGWESYSRHYVADRKTWDEVEEKLGRDWEAHRNERDLTWEDARPATRDAWERAEKQKRRARA